MVDVDRPVPQTSEPNVPISRISGMKIVIGIIVAAVLLGIGIKIGTAISKSSEIRPPIAVSPTPSEIPSPSVIPIEQEEVSLIPTDSANWQTYESDDGGFRLIYPPTWRTTLCNDFSNDRFPEAVLNFDFSGKKVPCGIGGASNLGVRFTTNQEVNDQINFAPTRYVFSLKTVAVGKDKIQSQRLELQSVLPDQPAAPDNVPSTTLFVPHVPKRNPGQYSHLVITYGPDSSSEKVINAVLASLELY